MAIKHRKLVPNSPTNQTGNCPDVCDPTCPYDCYPYPDFDYIPPPPLGPSPLSTNKAKHISPYVILIVSLLASLFLLVSYYAIIVKYCSGCSRFTRRIRRSSGPDEESLNEIHGPTIDHPIWYIATIGLQSSVINSITIFKYKRSDNLIEGSDCSVCLNEFQEDETLRLLPKCNHAFHISCIDTWLRSHTNCPLCRAQIIPNFVNTDFSAPTDQTSDLSVLNEQTHMENEGNYGEFDTNRVRNAEDSENRAVPEDGNGNEIPQVDDEPKEIENFKQDLDSNIDEKSCNNDMVMEDKVRQVRKSFSVDFDAIGDDVIDFSSFESEGSSGSPSGDGQKDDSRASYTRQVRIFGKMGGSSIEESLHKRPVTMKRSFSYSGRSFLARQHGSHNATLPV